MNPIKLSILTPSIPERFGQLAALQAEVARQAGDLPVEHLCLIDNRKRSIGAKRQALVDIARGEYIAFVDDDDSILPGYVEKLLEAAETRAGVLTFQQLAAVDGQFSEVHFRYGQQDGPFVPGGDTLRGPWHICAWRRDLVDGCQFGESNYGEDLVWCLQARKRISNGHHIPEILHEYQHSAATTAAPLPE